MAGIRPREVVRVKELFRAVDTALLDACDKHRNEGGFDRRHISRPCRRQAAARSGRLSFFFSRAIIEVRIILPGAT